MKKMKLTFLTISIALIVNLFNVPTIFAEDPYEEGLRNYQNGLKEEQQSDLSIYSGEPVIVGQLIKIIFKELAKKADDVIVTATKNNIKTKIKNHFIVQAVSRGITEIMVDNILAEVATGMNKVLKFDDVIGNSRIMYDPNSKLTVVISKFENTLITTYFDEDNSVDRRIKEGRWIPGSWKFK